jgi:hypothetical protein
MPLATVLSPVHATARSFRECVHETETALALVGLISPLMPALDF